MMNLRRNLLIPLASACLLLSAAVSAWAETETFDAMAPEVPPSGFESAVTGKGGAPQWVVKPAPDQQAGRVVLQSSAVSTDYRYPLLIKTGVSLKNLDLSTKFRPMSGQIDQAAGLVWRYQNPDNYYVVRANALEDNVVLYKVEKGTRIDLPLKDKGRSYGASAPVSKTGWNTLAVQIRGKVFTVLLNGNRLYEVEDETFPESGGIGLWTKADSVIMFKDLVWAAAP